MIKKNSYLPNGNFSQSGTPFDTTGEERNIRSQRCRVLPSQFCLWNMPVRFTLIRDISPDSEETDLF